MSAARSLKMPFRPDVRGDRLDAQRHPIEDRPRRLRSHVAQPQPPALAECRDRSAGPARAGSRRCSPALVEELERERDVAASTKSTWLMNAAFGTPSREHVKSVAGIRPWKQEASDSRRRGSRHERRSGARGPASGRRSRSPAGGSRVHGHVIHGSASPRAAPINASRSTQRSHCASTHDALRLGRRRALDEHALHLTARARRAAARTTSAAWPFDSQVGQHLRDGGVRHEGDEVPAVVVDRDRRRPARRSARAGRSGCPMWIAMPSWRKAANSTSSIDLRPLGNS